MNNGGDLTRDNACYQLHLAKRSRARARPRSCESVLSVAEETRASPTRSPPRRGSRARADRPAYRSGRTGQVGRFKRAALLTTVSASEASSSRGAKHARHKIRHATAAAAASERAVERASSAIHGRFRRCHAANGDLTSERVDRALPSPRRSCLASGLETAAVARRCFESLQPTGERVERIVSQTGLYFTTQLLLGSAKSHLSHKRRTRVGMSKAIFHIDTCQNNMYIREGRDFLESQPNERCPKDILSLSNFF